MKRKLYYDIAKMKKLKNINCSVCSRLLSSLQDKYLQGISDE